jgi:hypothetical protein
MVLSGARSLPEKTVTRKNRILLFIMAIMVGALALAAVRARDASRVATGFVAHVLCSETFVSGLDSDSVFSETMAAMPGTGLITWALDYTIDRARKDVTVTLLGGGQSHAVFREGLGCYLSHGEEPSMARCRLRQARCTAPCCPRSPAPL